MSETRELLRSEIYDKMEDFDEIVKTDIMDDLDSIEDTYRVEIRNLITCQQKELDQRKQVLDEYLVKLEEEKQRSKLFNDFIKSLPVIRQYLNSLINQLYNELSDKDKDTLDTYDYLSFKSYIYIQRPNVLNSNGTKYALSLIEGMIQNVQTSKELCIFYLKLNDKMHPKLKPKTLITENIDKMINVYEKDCIPKHYKDLFSYPLLLELKKDVDLLKI